jgi:hypothetical protein
MFLQRLNATPAKQLPSKSTGTNAPDSAIAAVQPIAYFPRRAKTGP